MMKNKTRFIFNEWLFSLLAWLIMLYFYYFIAVFGQAPLIKHPVYNDYIESLPAQFEIFLNAFVFGSLFTIINVRIEKAFRGHTSLGFIILIKTILYSAAMAIAIGIIYFVFKIFNLMNPETYRVLMEMMTPRYVISLVLYLLFSILLINFLLHVNRKFGRGVLLKMISGGYHKPHEEERIFLFLDLKGSTTLAEHMGHRIYSRLLRECIHDLTEIVLDYRAEIYQYVGDEVVLSWKINNGTENQNCLRLVFAYADKLESRRGYYIDEFSTVPQFRSGMSCGKVSVTEIGDLKREIAYHGDVLNTASRIQGEAKRRDECLIISDELLARLEPTVDFECQALGNVALKGKHNHVNLCVIKVKS